MMKGRDENRPVCGGIVEQHLHLSCGCCGYTRLMRCAPPALTHADADQTE